MSEKKPFPIEISTSEGQKKHLALTIGTCAVALFREKPEVDYLAVQHDHEGDTVWTMIFGQEELVDWMGAVTLTTRRDRNLRASNRTNGTFRENFGWNPDVVVEDTPSENELENYFDYLKADLTDAGLERFMYGDE